MGSEMAVSGFTAGSKYATISKEFYREIMTDLDRVRTSLSIDDAKTNVEHLIEKLRMKYEPKYDVEARLKQADASKLGPSI